MVCHPSRHAHEAKSISNFAMKRYPTEKVRAAKCLSASKKIALGTSGRTGRFGFR